MTAENELAAFIARFSPEMQARIRACRAKMRARFPDAVELVYDNYNFLVIGYGPTGRASDAILSLAAHARGVNLCFLQHGPELPDPGSILRGRGNAARNLALEAPEDLDRPDVGAIIEAALERAGTPDAGLPGRRADHQVGVGEATPAPLTSRRAAAGHPGVIVPLPVTLVAICAGLPP